MQNWDPTQLEAHLDKGEAVFLKLWKKGCGACKLSVPAIERIEAADNSGLQFGQIDVGDYPEMLEIADTDVLPCFFIFRDQKIKGKFIGFKGLKKLQDFVDEHSAG